MTNGESISEERRRLLKTAREHLHDAADALEGTNPRDSEFRLLTAVISVAITQLDELLL